MSAIQLVDTGLLTSAPLNPDERKELDLCEGILTVHLEKAFECWMALVTIRDKRLYREEFRTFEEYCQARWKISARRANQLCAAPAVLLNVTEAESPAAGWATLPVSERVLRPLASLPPEEQRQAWTEAVQTAAKGKVTARHVEEVVRKHRQQDENPRELVPPKEKEKEFIFRPLPEFRPMAVKDSKRLAAAERAVSDLVRLIEDLGTADSATGADLQLALRILQKYRDHVERVEQMLAAKAA